MTPENTENLTEYIVQKYHAADGGCVWLFLSQLFGWLQLPEYTKQELDFAAYTLQREYPDIYAQQSPRWNAELEAKVTDLLFKASRQPKDSYFFVLDLAEKLSLKLPISMQPNFTDLFEEFFSTYELFQKAPSQVSKIKITESD